MCSTPSATSSGRAWSSRSAMRPRPTGTPACSGPWAAPCGPPGAAPAGTSTSGAATRRCGPAPPGASAARPPASTPAPTGYKSRPRSPRSRLWRQTARTSGSKRVVVVVVQLVVVGVALARRILLRSGVLGRGGGVRALLVAPVVLGDDGLGAPRRSRRGLRNSENQCAAKNGRYESAFHGSPLLT